MLLDSVFERVLCEPDVVSVAVVFVVSLVSNVRSADCTLGQTLALEGACFEHSTYW